MEYKSILKSKIEQFILKKHEHKNALKFVEEIRRQKNNLEDEINCLIDDSNLEGKTFKVKDKIVSQKHVTLTQNITLKYIENIIDHYRDNSHEQINTKLLMKYIKDNRPVHTKKEIKINELN